MRARNIKPGFYRSDELAECSFAARLLAPGLWMMADRQGRLEDRPKKIKGEVLPYDAIDIIPLLDELEKNNHIMRYEVDGKKYIQILTFSEHQNPHYSEKDSSIPAPSSKILGKDIPSSNDNSENLPESTALKEGVKRADSLIPDTLIIDTTVSKTKSENVKKTKNEYSQEFSDAWDIYPKNSGSKKLAQSSFNKAIKQGAAVETVMQGIRNYATFLAKSGHEVAHFATWLNQNRWEVDYDSVPIRQQLGAAPAHQRSEAEHQAIIEKRRREVYGADA